MYNVKRIIEKMQAITSTVNSNSEADQMGEGLDNLCSLVTDAVVEVDILEKQSMDTPQEMRDFFAGAALVGMLIDAKESTLSPTADFSTASWDMSDAMMVERAKRIEERKAVGQ